MDPEAADGSVRNSHVDHRQATIGDIEQCIPALRRYAAVLARNQQDQDDLVHDCLVRALDRWHMRREDASLKSWLFAIMHNLFVSNLRKRMRRDEVSLADTVEDERYRISAEQERYVEFRNVARALERLPEEQRSILVLVAVEDLSYAEVAQVLDIPIGTVMSRLSRGREKLRTLMEAGGRTGAVMAK